MTVAERDSLLQASLPEDETNPASRRYAVRRDDTGRLQFFEAKFTEEREGARVFHGHPTRRVPARILRRFRDQGLICQAEYRACLRELG